MKKSKPLRAAIFDLDGTLVDSLPLVLRSIAHAIEPFGPPRPTMEIFARLGGPPERFLPGLIGSERDVPEALARMDDYHRANQHQIAPFAGAKAALQELRRRGVNLAVWTGRDRASGEELLKSHAMTDLFATVVYGDDLPTHKPEPEGMRAILERLDVPARDALFVGDADVDVLGGCAGGVDTLLIRHARTIAADVQAKAWRSVASPSDAFEVLLACTA